VTGETALKRQVGTPSAGAHEANADGFIARGIPLIHLWPARPRTVAGDGKRCMKLVTAIIKPSSLDDVREALSDIGVAGVTVTEVKGFGRQQGHTEIYRGAEYAVEFLSKVKLEAAVDEDMVEPVTQTIAGTAKAGEVGDGKVFVSDLGEAVRIRTGETGPEAL
jgi:nitrogen regulatory protein P-II 2